MWEDQRETETGRDREVLEEPLWFHTGCLIFSSLEVRYVSTNTFEIPAPATIWLWLMRNSEPDHPAELLLNSCPQKLWGRILKWTPCLKPLSFGVIRLATKQRWKRKEEKDTFWMLNLPLTMELLSHDSQWRVPSVHACDPWNPQSCHYGQRWLTGAKNTLSF